MIFGLGKLWRQFWKAHCKYFPKIIFIQPSIAVFGGRIVMKSPFFFNYNTREREREREFNGHLYQNDCHENSMDICIKMIAMRIQWTFVSK